MKFLHFNLLWGAAACALLTGCIDNKYDLDNLDTTSEFKVNDLVLPINLEPVLLSDIIRVEEGDKLKEVTIGGNTFYAVEQTGDFYSDGIDISAFTAEANRMEPKTALFAPEDAQMQSRRKAGGRDAYFLVEPVREELDYNSVDPVNGSIRGLDVVYFDDLVFEVTMAVRSLSKDGDYELLTIVLQLPKGLNVWKVMAGGKQHYPETYDPQTGMLSLTGVKFTGGVTDIRVTANSIDMSYYPGAFKYDSKLDSGSFNLISEFNIEGGEFYVGSYGSGSVPEQVECDVNFTLEDMHATSILGKIAYNLEGTGLEIEPIDLEDLPDFLDDPETDLILNNPQIYINLDNPVGDYALGYHSSLDIVAHRTGHADVPFYGPEIKVPATTGSFNFLLAPEPSRVNVVPEQYASGLKGVVYPDLGNILAGDGVPELLDVSLVNPEIPEQQLGKPFVLDNEIPGMHGDYMFLAPLSLREGSQIVKTVDGWWSEDLADLNIDYLTISATATNDLPTGVILSLYAIDRDGNKISTEGSVKLDLNAIDTPIELTVKGLDGEPFNNLDGIRIYVVAGSDSLEPLAPSQTITLDNIKGKVTGFYLRKL